MNVKPTGRLHYVTVPYKRKIKKKIIIFLLPLRIIQASTVLKKFIGKVSTSSPQIRQPRTSSLNFPLSLSANPPPLPTHCWQQSLLYNPATLTGFRPCNTPRCKTCSIHDPVNLFTSSCTNLTYPITTHADYKSMNLIYWLQCTECKAFTLEKPTAPSLCINGHRFTTTISIPDLPLAIHT